MQTTTLEYQGADDERYVGYLARPAQPNGAGILIAHGAPGISAHERRVAERLANLGYVALAADYHGAGETIASERVRTRVTTLLQDSTGLRAAMQAGLAALRLQPGVDAGRIAVIGYCMGGAAALELAYTGADAQAFIGFHATLPEHAPKAYRAIKGKVLILHGAGDPLVSDAERAAFEKNMNAAGVDWRMVLYGGAVHAFTMENAAAMNRAGIAYHKLTDARSWRAMLDLFGESIDQR